MSWCWLGSGFINESEFKCRLVWQCCHFYNWINRKCAIGWFYHWRVLWGAGWRKQWERKEWHGLSLFHGFLKVHPKELLGHNFISPLKNHWAITRFSHLCPPFPFPLLGSEGSLISSLGAVVCLYKVSQIRTNLSVSLVKNLTHIPLPTPALRMFPPPPQRNIGRLSKSISFPTILNSLRTEVLVQACWV